MALKIVQQNQIQQIVAVLCHLEKDQQQHDEIQKLLQRYNSTLFFLISQKTERLDRL